MTIQEFIDTNRVSMKCERTDRNQFMDGNMDHWKCHIRRAGKHMTVTFSQGYGHHGAEPELAGVLDCLSSDASYAADYSFEEWCSNLGYDTDSRKAERIYKACEQTANRLARFLGEALYSQLLGAERC